MRLMTVAGAALLAAMTFSADAEAVECFTVTSEDFDSDWSLIVASRCPYAAYWDMCVTFTWQSPKRFSGVLQPNSRTRKGGTLPNGEYHFHWEYTWLDGRPPDEAACLDPKS